MVDPQYSKSATHMHGDESTEESGHSSTDQSAGDGSTNLDSQTDNSPHLGSAIPPIARLTGGTFFWCLLAMLVAYPSYVVATNLIVDFSTLYWKCGYILAALATIGYCGFVISKNSHWPNRDAQRDGRMTGIWLIGFSLVIQIPPAIVVGFGFLTESFAIATLGLVAFVVTGVIGVFALALGFAAAITGFAPTDETVNGLIRSLRKIPTNPGDFDKGQ